MGDEPGAHELADEHGEVGRDGVHARLEIIVQLDAVLREAHHLIRELLDVVEIILRDLGAHGDHGGVLEVLLDVLVENPGEVVLRRRGAVAHQHHEPWRTACCPG